MTTLRAAIIGLGPRGLSVLERIVTLGAQRQAHGRRVRVDVIDPTADGSGLHAVDQPDYLLLNTICAELSMFPGAVTVPAGTETAGPSLYEWVRDRGMRLAEDGYSLGEHGRPVRHDDFLPRRVLGEYLRWFLQSILDRAPRHVDIVVHRTAAVSLAAERGQWRIDLAGGAVLCSEYVFLTTGHTPNRSSDAGPGAHRVIRTPYPLPSSLDWVQPGDTLAVAGFGLSAMDVLAALTVGRGGRFNRVDGALRYQPGGDEPRVLMYSRSGLPYRARPAPDLTREPYRPVAFTPEALDALRESRQGPLDLLGDVLPLLLTEMRVAYHRRCAQLSGPLAADTFERALDSRASPGNGAALADLLEWADARYGEFDPATHLLTSDRTFSDGAAYQARLIADIADDLEHARAGLARSPLKAALELLRSLRDIIRHAVEFDRLTDAGVAQVTADLVPLMNRTVIGPQAERNEELIALVESGVVATPLGAGPQLSFDEGRDRWMLRSTRLRARHTEAVEWICKATVEQTDVERSASSLISGLNDAGIIRRFRPHTSVTRGLDVTPDLHPVGPNGATVDTLWALGPACEGATFFNHYVPSPGRADRALFDAHRCVAEMFDAHEARAALRRLAPSYPPLSAHDRRPHAERSTRSAFPEAMSSPSTAP